MAQSINVLLNGSLSGSYASFRNNEQWQTPTSWLPWWLPHQKDDPDWKNQTPTYLPFEIEEGVVVQRLETPWATHTAGLLQQFPAAPGNRYRISAECQAWSSESEEEGTIVESSDVNIQIGVDPTGGLDPTSPLIKWSSSHQPFGEWKKLELIIEAENTILTLYLKSAPSLPKRQQAIFWRNAAVQPLDRYRRTVSIVGPGDTHITLEPEQPEPGGRVTATVSSLRNQPFIDLMVRRPDEQTAVVAFQGLTQENDRSIWRYDFGVDEPGIYDIRFVGDSGARLMALQLLRVEEEDPLAEAAEAAPSGKARFEYHRVYVLLPPTADRKWLNAAAQGSFDGRYTIGFSADDAGVGEIAGRHVLAVNPHHWPETLTAAWFHKNYPGTRFTAVVANTPEDLESWLNNWTEDV
ncbi:MAG: hypothetical protein WAM60_01825 [Candidatus Promineifilaceae bacterium]